MRRPAEDDRPIGRILTRREILGLLGGSALVAACAPIVTRSESLANATRPIVTEVISQSTTSVAHGAIARSRAFVTRRVATLPTYRPSPL